MRRNLLRTTLAIALLIALLYPVSRILSAGQGDLSVNDADHTVVPMLELLAQSPVYGAGTEVEPLENIENIWAIEDTRRQAEQPLVTGMRNGGSELGYDEESQTFFCTLGNDAQDMQWPQLQLFAQGDESLRVCWVDDYAYDEPQEALSRGYRYELMAYTQTEYAYFGIVFTGLPIATIHVPEGVMVNNEYVPARVSLSAYDEAPIVETAMVHDRGLHNDIGKPGYRMEFHTISYNGRDKKNPISLMEMEPDTDWVLLSNNSDELTVTNYLAFDMWKRWKGEDALMALDCCFVEVFFQNEYMGVYQLIQTPDGAREIAHAGGDVQRDCLIKLTFDIGNKQVLNAMDTCGFIGECHYEASGNEKRALDLFENFVLLNRDVEPLDDEAFVRLAQKCVDVDDLISYYLFINACGLVRDNTHNNLFVWSAWDGERYRYQFGVWDMDWGLWLDDYLEDGTPASYLETSFTLATRLLDLNALGSREKLWALWKEKRDTILTDEALEDWILPVQDELQRSGAYLRESEKWLGGAQYLNLETMLMFQKAQVAAVERMMQERWPLEVQQ